MEYRKYKRRLKVAGEVAVTLLVSFMITFLGVLGLAFALLLFPISEEMVEVGILILYILSCFVAGKMVGKQLVKKSFLWGAFLGCVYYFILVNMSILCNSTTVISIKDVGTSVLLCSSSGALGSLKYKGKKEKKWIRKKDI